MAKRLKIELDINDLVKKSSSSSAVQDAYFRALSNNSIKREFGKRCIDFIIDRTLKGYDKNNKPFEGYSKSYKKSDTFKIYNKSASKVNLKLTGEMQASIDVLSATKNKVVLGFVDQLENDKAHGHVNGSNFLPVRDFWEINQSEQIKILKSTLKDFEDLEEISISQDTPVEVRTGDQEIDLDLEF